MTNLRLTLPLPPSGQEPRPLPLHAEPMDGGDPVKATVNENATHATRRLIGQELPKDAS